MTEIPEKPFGLLSKEHQQIIRDAWPDIECYVEGYPDGFWRPTAIDSPLHSMAYRLKPNYEAIDQRIRDNFAEYMRPMKPFRSVQDFGPIDLGQEYEDRCDELSRMAEPKEYKPLPPWTDAPDWAQWRTIGQDGTMSWWSTKPGVLLSGHGDRYHWGVRLDGTRGLAEHQIGYDPKNWRDSLEKRPLIPDQVVDKIWKARIEEEQNIVPRQWNRAELVALIEEMLHGDGNDRIASSSDDMNEGGEG